MAIAFFDLDKTLISDNSAKLWLKSQWGSGKIKTIQMIRASYWLAKYHLGFTNMDQVIEKSLSLVEGESEGEVLRLTMDFFNSTVKNLYRPGALKAIAQHKKNGHQISLLTSSFEGLAQMVADHLELDHCLCTKLEVNENGTFTGKTLGAPCFGKHKVFYASKLCQQQKVSLSDCSFYTDSATDIPLMALVGTAVAVNPDPHLRTRAQLKKWKIVDWGRPAND